MGPQPFIFQDLFDDDSTDSVFDPSSYDASFDSMSENNDGHVFESPIQSPNRSPAQNSSIPSPNRSPAQNASIPSPKISTIYSPFRIPRPQFKTPSFIIKSSSSSSKSDGTSQVGDKRKADEILSHEDEPHPSKKQKYSQITKKTLF